MFSRRSRHPERSRKAAESRDPRICFSSSFRSARSKLRICFCCHPDPERSEGEESPHLPFARHSGAQLQNLRLCFCCHPERSVPRQRRAKSKDLLDLPPATAARTSLPQVPSPRAKPQSGEVEGPPHLLLLVILERSSRISVFAVASQICPRFSPGTIATASSQTASSRPPSSVPLNCQHQKSNTAPDTRSSPARHARCAHPQTAGRTHR